jgi:hypothetical protein
MNSKGFQFSILLLWLLCMNPTYLFSQNPSSRFREIFEKETADNREPQYGDFKNTGPLSFFPDTLPKWFFQPPLSSPGIIYTIGISDPDMPEEEALQQAFYRARVLASMFYRSRVEYIRDIFTSNQEDVYQRGFRQRFDTFFRITARLMADSSQFQIIDQHLTRYNESIVLVSYMPQLNQNRETNGHADKIISMAKLLYIEAQIGDAFEPQSSYEIISTIQNAEERKANALFISTKKGNRELIDSEFLGKKIIYPLFVYRYANPQWPAYTRPLISYNGLWAIFAQEFLEHITLTTEQSTLRLKNMSQQTAPDLSDMSREVSSMNAYIYLNKIEFTNQKIEFDVTLEELP